MKLLDIYKGIACSTVRNGNSVFFWKDIWNGNILSLQNPELNSFAKYNESTVAQVLQEEEFQDLFHLPLSVQENEQFQAMQALIQDHHLSNEEDIWTYIWNTAVYSVGNMP